MEKRDILAARRRTESDRRQAAALLGITRTQLHTRLKRFELAPESAVQSCTPCPPLSSRPRTHTHLAWFHPAAVLPEWAFSMR